MDEIGNGIGSLFSHIVLVLSMFCSVYLTNYIPSYFQIPLIGASIIYIGSAQSTLFIHTSVQAITNKTIHPVTLTANNIFKYLLYFTLILCASHFLTNYMGQINMLLLWYFSYLGTISLKYWTDSILKHILPSSLRTRATPILSKIRVLGMSYTLNIFDSISFMLSSVVVIHYIVTQSWVSNNLIAFSFILYLSLIHI